MPLCGGTGESTPATDSTQALVDQLKESVEKKAGKTFGSLQALEQATQVSEPTWCRSGR